MPYKEKYSSMLDYTKLVEGFVLPLEEKDLGAHTHIKYANFSMKVFLFPLLSFCSLV